MSEEQIIQFLQENIDYMVNNDLVLWLFRTIGWYLVKGLSYLIGLGKDLYDMTFRLVDITAWTGVDQWINEFRPLIVTLVVVSLVVLGMMLMFGKNKNHNILTSILIFAVVATSSTFLFSTFNNWTIVFKDAVISGEGVADGTALINSNLYDLVYIDEQIGLANMNEGNRPQYTSLTEQEVDYIRITETMDWDDVENSDTKDILKKRLVYRNSAGNQLVDVSNGVAWTTIGNDLYFRYKFQWFTYFLDALSVLLIYFCLAYKNVRIIYELLVGRVIGTLKASDLSGEKKMVRILSSIRDEYYALCFTAITLRTYFVFTDFVKIQTGDHGILRGLITLFVTFCVIDGSNIMQQITGVDAGLSSMTGKILAGSHILQGAKNSLYQHQMKSAMKHPAGDTKGRENMSDLNGSRIGMMGFRDPNAQMDSDLSGKENDAATQTEAEKETSAYPNGQTDAGHETSMEEAMQESKSTGGQDADASMEAMERDLEPGNSDVEQRGMDPEDSGVKAMEQEENSAAGQEMDAMDQNAERNSVSGSGAGEQEAHTKMEPDGKMHGESGGSSGEPAGESAKKGTMFDRWAAKSAGQGAAAGEETGESARSAFLEEGEAKHTPPFPEPGQNEKTKGKQEGSPSQNHPAFSEPQRNQGQEKKEPEQIRRETQRSAFQEKGSATGEQAGKAAYERMESHRTVDSKIEKKATIPTSEGRSAKITEEQNGRDRYVGGEAVPRRGNSKWSEKEKK